MADKPTTSSAAEFALQALVAAGHVSQELVDKAMALPGAPQPAHSGEPVAFIHWPINGPPRLAWYSQKALNDAILKTYEGHQPDVELYTAPQPVGREPLTHAQAKALVSKYGNDPLHLVYQVEVAHGIKKGGQHGVDRL